MSIHIHAYKMFIPLRRKNRKVQYLKISVTQKRCVSNEKHKWNKCLMWKKKWKFDVGTFMFINSFEITNVIEV